MTRRILIELALFGAPFLVFFLYRLATRDASIKDKWPLAALISIGGVLAVSALIIAALLEPSDEGLCFEAGRYENGVFIEGRKVPCDQIERPDYRGATSAAANDPTEPVDPAPESEPAAQDAQ